MSNLIETPIPLPQSPRPTLPATGRVPETPADRRLRRDLRTLSLFIETWCRAHHARRRKAPVRMKSHDVPAIAGCEVSLCASCRKLLQHSWVKRTTCPLDPKPACKHCPSHCYHPYYRRRIRMVMRDSGRRLLMRGRLDYLLKLLF